MRLIAVTTRHAGFAGLLLAGAALRAAVIGAHRPAFWYRGDSGAYLNLSLHPLHPDQYRPLGYVVALKALHPVGTAQPVVIAQHLLGLAVAVAVYALLYRRGLPRWLSALAAAVALFDSLQLTLEHYLLAETLVTALLVAAVFALLWRPAPGPLACAGAGLLLAAAWFTKPLVLPAAVVFGGYLALRRVGWRRMLAFAAALALPALGVLAWVDGRPSPYGSNSTAIYGRMASIADCDRPELAATLTPAERELCPSPAQRGQRPDYYLWVAQAPGYPYRLRTDAYPHMRGFALKVLAAQPAAYLRVVGKEITAHLVPGVDLGPSYACLRERFALPATARELAPDEAACHPQLAIEGETWFADPRTNPPATGLSTALSRYDRIARTSQLVASLGLGLTLIALAGVVRAGRARPGRADSWPLVRDAAMLAAAGAALIVPPVLVGMYEVRYALPALPLLSLAAALSAWSLTARRRRSSSPIMTLGS